MALWGNKDSKTASGTVSIANTGVVTGSSTAFTTEAKIGNTLKANGVEYEIVTITSDTAAKVIMGKNNGNGAVTTQTGQSYTLSEKPAFVAHESSQQGNFGGSGDSSFVYGVDTTEAEVAGKVVNVAVAIAGSGYVEAPAVAFSGGGGSSAAATASIAGGVVTSIAVTNDGSGYTSVPTVNLAVPRLTIATSAVDTTAETITYTAHGLSAGEQVKYYKVGSGTAIGGLTDATSYYAGQVTANSFKLYDTRAHGTTAVATLTVATSGVNTTTDTITSTGHGLVNGAQVNYSNQGGASITGLTSGNDYYVVGATANTFQLSATANGAAIDLTGTGNNSQTFASTGNLNLTGTGNNAQYFDKLDQTTATAVADLSSGTGGSPAVAHAGWVRRTVGTGGRAGRIQYETLVAMGSLSGDQSDDIQFPDA